MTMKIIPTNLNIQSLYATFTIIGDILDHKTRFNKKDSYVIP